MPTPNNNNSITYFELALLAEDVYKDPTYIADRVWFCDKDKQVYH
jgi:hypothetical protein